MWASFSRTISHTSPISLRPQMAASGGTSTRRWSRPSPETATPRLKPQPRERGLLLIDHLIPRFLCPAFFPLSWQRKTARSHSLYTLPSSWSVPVWSWHADSLPSASPGLILSLLDVIPVFLGLPLRSESSQEVKTLEANEKVCTGYPSKKLISPVKTIALLSNSRRF
jgi:hypothetical protein